MTMITAHSGCEDTQRDSLEAVNRAVLYGADAVEMDVRQDENGSLRVSHNHLTLTEYADKPLFESALQRIAPTNLKLNCDIKESAALYPTLRLAKKYGFEKPRLILTGCVSPEQVARDENINQSAQVFINLEEVLKFFCIHDLANPKAISDFSKLMNEPWSFVKKMNVTDELIETALKLVQQLGVTGLNMPWPLVSDSILDSVSKAEIPLSVWTVNQPDTATWLMEHQVYNVTTLQVMQAVAIRKQFVGQNA
jgi:glycerophosphoryl diester phosphodiesterase